MAIIQYEHAYPIDFQKGDNLAQASSMPSNFEAKVSQYIMTWRQQARSVFIQRRNIWDACWKLYRGEDDFNMKQDWQSKIVLPKAFTSVKMATNTIKRLLSASKKPWDIESVNPDDIVQNLRGEQMTDLTKLFMDKAHFLKEFSEGLEVAFLIGIGVWKVWWGMVPRTHTRIENRIIPASPSDMFSQGQNPNQFSILRGEAAPQKVPPPFGQPRFGYREQNTSVYPTQLGAEYLNPMGLEGGTQGAPSAPQSYLNAQRDIVQEEIMEGQLFIRAVDPYNFYWLPGSKLNRWVGTIEDVEIPKWELYKMAHAGLFSLEKVKQIQPRRIDERYKMSNLRFSETVMTQNGPNEDTAVVKLTEYFGPLVWDGEIIEEYAHVVLGNDSTVLLMQKNPFLTRQPPYVAFSPLNLPFRTEGVGIVEMVRTIDQALSQLANLSMDTLVFKLMPLFEVAVDSLENPEDIETGVTPGKILRKNLASAGMEAIRPVQFNDVSQGAVQTWSSLDRSHQEGSLISDIAEGLPRNRGQQTATETQILSQQSESFMGGIAADIENEALEPMVKMCMDLIFQFIDTANDPRVASILGVGAETLRGMSREDILELIAGDYKVKVTGITGQIMKSEMLQNLVQFMNLLGQNPQAWLPYINEDALLRRLLEAFRPHIHDIEDIVADPATAQAKRLAMLDQEQMNILLRSMPGMFGAIQKHNAANADRGLALQQMEHAKEMQQMQQQADSVQQAKDQQMQQIQMMHAAAMQGVQPGQGQPPQGGGPPPPPYAPPPMANVGQ
jgi:hypothetical protein